MMLKKVFVVLLLLLLEGMSSCGNEPKSASGAAPGNSPGPAQSGAASQEDRTKAALPPMDTTRRITPPLAAASPGPSRPFGRTSKNTTPTSNGRSQTKLPGTPGYITRQNVFLQKEPSAGSPKIAPLKLYEIVYILETLMKDEHGRPAEYPTWYKVELENKQQGWVVGNSVNAGAGG